MATKTEFSSVFKFRTSSEQHLEQLKNCFVWFAKPESFSDPDEGVFKLNDSLSMEGAIRYAKRVIGSGGMSLAQAERLIMRRVFDTDFLQKLTEISQAHHDEMNDKAKAMRHLSLAGNLKKYPQPEFNNAGNIELWKDYANDFKGFCIEFEADALLDSLKTLKPSAKIIHQKIVYNDTAPQRSLDEATDELLFQYLRHYGRKRSAYLPEFEWRVSSSEEGKHYFSPSVVKRILLGGNLEAATIERLSRELPTIYPSSDIIVISSEIKGGTLPIKVIYRATH